MRTSRLWLVAGTAAITLIYGCENETVIETRHQADIVYHNANVITGASGNLPVTAVAVTAWIFVNAMPSASIASVPVIVTSAAITVSLPAPAAANSTPLTETASTITEFDPLTAHVAPAADPTTVSLPLPPFVAETNRAQPCSGSGHR